jgi:glycosyltransferase involved in cell wall biosynthesis
MKCLWLTLADPEPPTNGQFLYSSGLIRGTAATGAEVHVVGLRRSGARHGYGQQGDGAQWWLADHPARSRWAGLLSQLPQISAQTKTRSMQRIIRELLSGAEWDAIVFDSICVGWALSLVQQHYAHSKSRPKLVYLSHNHEESVARAIADSVRHPLRRRIKRIDALKVAHLERALARNADLVTSNSPDDCQKFRDGLQGRPVEFLPPGYGGPRTLTRHISSVIPRRAIIVGSFDWIAKRVSLEDFLEVADRQFAKAGVELYVVGSAEETFLARLRRKCVATKFTGRVPDIGSYVSQARLALVPDQLGGFKLKALDYVFNRLPILGISGSVPGMPLHPGESILLYPDHQALTRGVLEVIDNFDVLNQMQDLAYTACHDQFDWEGIGRRLVRDISRQSISEPFQPYVPAAIPTTAL